MNKNVDFLKTGSVEINIDFSVIKKKKWFWFFVKLTIAIVVIIVLVIIGYILYVWTIKSAHGEDAAPSPLATNQTTPPTTSGFSNEPGEFLISEKTF